MEIEFHDNLGVRTIRETLKINQPTLAQQNIPPPHALVMNKYGHGGEIFCCANVGRFLFKVSLMVRTPRFPRNPPPMIKNSPIEPNGLNALIVQNVASSIHGNPIFVHH